ncbi:MAG: NCS2 family permease [Spirochaetia bacterium]|nr:NCS2 family permease [Spirochaetia bacterium]
MQDIKNLKIIAMNYNWWKKGDLDGFFGLFVDNLIQLILIVVLCTYVAGFPSELIYGRILPAVALSILFGNILYALQARRLAIKTGDGSVTALPYGVNTVSLFAFILFVIKPVMDQTGDYNLAWKAGLAACLGSGIIEFAGSFVVGWVKKVTPRAALLTTLAGIAVTFIAMDFSFRIFKDPLVSFAPLAIIFIQYIGKKSLPFKIPAGLVAVIVGTLLAWSLGRMNFHALIDNARITLQFPHLFLSELFNADFLKYMIEFLPVIIPMGLFNLMGSLQNLESAEAAGDKYEVKESLIINGTGTIAAAFFGSVFPTTIYIGHPGWKAMGAGWGYSIANGAVIGLLCFLGLVSFATQLIPVEAGAAILLWIGVVIAAQAFQSTPGEHAVAIVIGFLPALASWGLLMMETALRAASTSIAEVGLDKLSAQLPIHGLIAMDRGFIFTSMILAAMTVAVIDKKFQTAALWTLVASAVSATGMIHGFALKNGAIVNSYGPATTWPFVLGYAAMGVIFLVTHYFLTDKDFKPKKKNV